MIRERWRWRLKLGELQPVDPRQSLTVAVTLAYQHPAHPQARRGIAVTLFVVTLWFGWHFTDE